MQTWKTFSMHNQINIHLRSLSNEAHQAYHMHVITEQLGSRGNRASPRSHINTSKFKEKVRHEQSLSG